MSDSHDRKERWLQSSGKDGEEAVLQGQCYRDRLQVKTGARRLENTARVRGIRRRSPEQTAEGGGDWRGWASCSLIDLPQEECWGKRHTGFSRTAELQSWLLQYGKPQWQWIQCHIFHLNRPPRIRRVPVLVGFPIMFPLPYCCAR